MTVPLPSLLGSTVTAGPSLGQPGWCRPGVGKETGRGWGTQPGFGRVQLPSAPSQPIPSPAALTSHSVRDPGAGEGAEKRVPEPTKGSVPREGPGGTQQARLDGAGSRTDPLRPCQRPGAPVPRGGRAGNEEEIPKPLSREKVTTEEKMPQRSGCPRPSGARERDTGQGHRAGTGAAVQPPLLQTPRSHSGRWPTSAWARPCASCARSSTSTRCSTP